LGKLLVTWLSFLIHGSNPTTAVAQPASAEIPSKVAETEDLGINSSIDTASEEILMRKGALDTAGD